MAASPKPPPARPHIALRPSNYFKAPDTVDDDAWDSASDGEEPTQSSFSFSTWNRPSSTTAPKPVPAPANSDNPSSSSLAFSYTHLNAPNPSSYPPRNSTDTSQPPKNGWTIVRTGYGRRSSNDTGSSIQDDSFDPVPDTETDADVEGDMILGDLDAEPTPDPSPSNSGSIRDDAEKIVNGRLHPPSSTLILICMYRSSLWNSPPPTDVQKI